MTCESQVPPKSYYPRDEITIKFERIGKPIGLFQGSSRALVRLSLEGSNHFPLITSNRSHNRSLKWSPNRSTDHKGLFKALAGLQFGYPWRVPTPVRLTCQCGGSLGTGVHFLLKLLIVDQTDHKALSGSRAQVSWKGMSASRKECPILFTP